MKRAWAIVALLAAGCAKQPATPSGGEAEAHLGGVFAKTEETAALKPAGEGIAAELGLVDEGLKAGREGTFAVAAGLDALLTRESVGLGRVGSPHALAYRTNGGLARVSGELERLHGRGDGGGLSRALVADAILEIARFDGDASRAATFRAASGAIQNMTFVGPIGLHPLSAIAQPTAVEAPGQPLAASYPTLQAFTKTVAPTPLDAEDGTFEPTRISSQAGLYAAVVDVDVKDATELAILFQSTSAATVVAGGAPVLTRPFATSGEGLVRAGFASVPAGRTRVVVRLAQNDDGGRFNLWIVDRDGKPVATSAPRVGDVAAGRVTSAGPWLPRPQREEGRDLFAAGALAFGDPRAARQALETSAQDPNVAPERALLFARAVMRADDVPENRRVERARSAYERARAKWPSSWEAVLGAISFTAARKGAAEGRVESMRDLDDVRAAQRDLDPVVTAYESATALEAHLRDVALTTFEASRAPLAETPLLQSLDAQIHPKTGAEEESRLCGAPHLDRNSSSCLGMHSFRGDFAGARAELARLRALRGSTTALQSVELSLDLAENKLDHALALYDQMLPGERNAVVLAAIAQSQPQAMKTRLERDEVTGRDMPGSIAPLLRLLGEDPAPEMQKKGRAAVLADLRAPQASAATLVLVHDERYALRADGLMHLSIHDVRRVSGTTDVENGIGGTDLALFARDTHRLTRRLIHKKDGRILEPDRAGNASQANADLSQLEPGDYIEQIIDGWGLPTRGGEVVVDTPDLLPERTSVASATIELRTPKDLPLARSAHPMLGKPEERDEGGDHVSIYRLTNAPARRFEEGVPRMDRDVSISFGTYTWKTIGASLADLFVALDEPDPAVAAWAKKAIGDSAPASREAIEKIVAASGKTIRVAQTAMISDMAAVLGGGGARENGTRSMLELGQGSRTWLVHRGLAELGVPSEVVIAEREPFSANPNFPARPGRFDRPLLRVKIAGADVFVDADVDGPPLPVGRVSPEIRGRAALTATGEIVTVPATDEALRDDIAVELAVDDKGDATGSFRATLRGRPAQALADALERVVGTERREMLRGVVLGYMPWANVDDVSLSSKEGAWEVQLAATLRIPAYAQKAGSRWTLPGLDPVHIVVPRPQVSTLASLYTTRLGRQSALAIDSALGYHLERRVTLPASIQVEARPAETVKDERLSASRSGSVAGNVLTETFDLSLSTGTVSVEGYEAFAKDVRRADDVFLAGVRSKLG